MKPGRPFRWEIVIKVGGSLENGRSLPRVLGRIARLARRRRILVIPGGGRFADLVRAERTRLSLDEAGAHRMALRAMEQYGLLLAGLCPAAKAVGDLGSARRLAARGRTPVLLVAPILERSRRLERSFRLTSDSIAAFIAGRVRAPRLVLVKSRPGGDGLPLRVGALRELARRGVVDPLFPALAPRRSDVRIIDGTDAAGWEGLLAEEAREAGGPVRPRAGRRGRRSPGPDRGRRRGRRSRARRGSR